MCLPDNICNYLMERRPCEAAAAIGMQQWVVGQVEQLQVRQPAQLPWHYTDVAVYLCMTYTRQPQAM